MNHPARPVSPDFAVQLLKQSINDAPSDATQRRVAARLAQSILLAPIPSLPAPPSALKLGALTAGTKVMAGVTLSMGVALGIPLGIAVDRFALSPTNTSETSTAKHSDQASPSLAVESPVESPQIEPVPTIRTEKHPQGFPPPARKHANPTAREMPSSPEPAAEPTEPEASLREQQVLLDRARLALGKGDVNRCITALESHRSRFPKSLLSEERDALTIKALVTAGNLTEARDRASTFVANYPRSIIIPSIESTVGRAK